MCAYARLLRLANKYVKVLFVCLFSGSLLQYCIWISFLLKSEKRDPIIIMRLVCGDHAVFEALNRELCDNVSGMTMSCYICAMTQIIIC